MTSILQYEQFVDNCTAILEQRFVDFVKAGECVDLGHWLQCYAFDVIGEITVSTPTASYMIYLLMVLDT